MTPSGAIAIPLCTNQMDKDRPPCGRPMFRVGTELNWAWFCEECDKRDPSNSLDSKIVP